MRHVRLKPKEDRRLVRGHLWVYRNEIAALPSLEDGQVVDVVSDRGRFVGRGFFQGKGGIAVRILSRHQEDIDASFLARRIDDAHAFRSRLFPGETAYRWVFGESDGLPGLVADRYGSVVAAETSCGFYALWGEALASAFLVHEGVEGVRLTVGGALHTFGVAPDAVDFSMDGLHVEVDLRTGQKTGLFLDQRLNYLAMRPYAAGARVLDGHCYLGLWGCHAAKAGAQTVLGVDTSAQAVDQARRIAQRNAVEQICSFEQADIAEVLERGELFDLIVLDPPALARSRDQSKKALGVYQALNRAAIEAVVPGGCLITSSCSHFVEAPAFLEALKRAAAAAQRHVWVLDVRGAAPDHPVLMAMPETAYLTCAILRVL